MTSRERTLALLLGGFAALFVGKWLIVDVVWGPISERTSKLNRAEDDLERKQVQRENQQEAADALKKWKAASLSADIDGGNPSVIYRGYLMDLLNAAGIKNPNVNVGSPQTVKDAFTKLPFQIDAHCDLAQLSKLLFEFERTDLMHRIQSIDLTPHVNSTSDKIEYISAKLDGEALAFKDAKPRDKLETGGKPDDRKFAEFKAFAEKNFFQPTKIVPKEQAKGELARDDRSAVKFHGVVKADGVDSYYFYNSSTSKFLLPLPTVGQMIEIAGMKAKIVGYDRPNSEVLLEVGEKVGAVRSGQALSTWKESPKKPAAIKLASQPIL